MTGKNLIYRALRSLGVLRAGQTANTDTLNDGLVALNDLIDAWNADSLTVPHVQRAVYDLVAGQADYTIGAGGDFDTDRPSSVYAAGIIDTDGNETPIRVTDEVQIAGIRLYTDRAFPVTNLNLSPAPAAGQQLALYTWAPLTAFADLDTNYSFPQGYALALRFCLADVLAPEVQAITKIPNPLLAEVAMKAREYKATIEAQNSVTPVMTCDDAALSNTSWPFYGGALV